MDYIENNFDSFSEGIALGGLHQGPEIKLLVCYLLKTLKKPLTRTQINEILSEHQIANYFEANSAVSELVASGQLLSEIDEGDEVLTITTKALLEVSTIERSLPRTIREKAVEAGLKILKRDKIKKESKVTVEKLDDGFHVTLSVEEMGTELLKITVYVSDERQIEIVKTNFFNHAADVYSNIISTLTVE